MSYTVTRYLYFRRSNDHTEVPDGSEVYVHSVSTPAIFRIRIGAGGQGAMTGVLDSSDSAIRAASGPVHAAKGATYSGCWTPPSRPVALTPAEIRTALSDPSYARMADARDAAEHRLIVKGYAPAPAAGGRIDIDWAVIDRWEGGTLRGEVPSPRSGVTLPHGLDLHERTDEDLRRYGLRDATRISEFLATERGHSGPVGPQARALLAAWRQRHPGEDVLPREVCENFFREYSPAFGLQVAAEFGRRSSVPFQSIPPAAQTVICSMRYRNGQTDALWRLAALQQWRQMADELRRQPGGNQGEHNRRLKEACHLETGLGMAHTGPCPG